MIVDFAVVVALAGCSRDGGPPPPPPVTLPSGLTIQELSLGQELAPGSGEEARDGRYVAVHYEARIAAVGAATRSDPPFDGTRGGEPFVARLGRTPLLPGFAEGLAGMKEGGRRRLTIPPALGFGATGKSAIPPDATLEYDVQLVDLFTVLPSGLQYHVVKEGEGEPPAVGQKVVVEYRAWLLETGRELSSSRMLGRALEFELGKGLALPGLEEALLLMRRGARWIVALPPELGYGPLGHGMLLQPGHDVLLDVEYKGTRPR